MLSHANATQGLLPKPCPDATLSHLAVELAGAETIIHCQSGNHEPPIQTTLTAMPQQPQPMIAVSPCGEARRG